MLSEGGIDVAKLLDESIMGGLFLLPHAQPRSGIQEPHASPEDGTKVGVVLEAVPSPRSDGSGERGVVIGHDAWRRARDDSLQRRASEGLCDSSDGGCRALLDPG